MTLRDGVFEKPFCSPNPAAIVEWCLEQNPDSVAVDAPCDWSQSGSSRAAERELAARGVRCFATPTRTHALAHTKGFYDWVFNGEELYRLLKPHYSLFEGKLGKRPACFETFPHAIVCALAGKVVAAKPKKIRRLKVLSEQNYDVSVLSNVDFIDAALCALTAEEFRKGRIRQFGIREEGIIVVPEFVARRA